MHWLKDISQKCDRDKSGGGYQEESDRSARRQKGTWHCFGRVEGSVGEFGEANGGAREREEIA